MSPRSALDLARSFFPDVADGYELARRLRDHSDRVPQLIAVTGYGQQSDRQRARGASFDHHLIKPIALDALLQLLAARS